jgi:hypothetical protein
MINKFLIMQVESKSNSPNSIGQLKNEFTNPDPHPAQKMAWTEGVSDPSER